VASRFSEVFPARKVPFPPLRRDTFKENSGLVEPGVVFVPFLGGPGSSRLWPFLGFTFFVPVGPSPEQAFAP